MGGHFSECGRGVYLRDLLRQFGSMSTAPYPEAVRSRVASRLLNKARELGLQLPIDLERLAIARGCNYYERDLNARIPPLGEVPLTNGELAIALITPSLRPTAREIRLAAALLGAPDVQIDEVATLAAEENCADIVHHIALCGRRFEPENP